MKIINKILLWKPIYRCAAYIVKLSLPDHIEAGKEARKYSDGDKGFHEIDFFNGTLWLRDKIDIN